ncbi:MAG: chromosome segregation protein SMC, partial [Saprospiraceae bacterium]
SEYRINNVPCRLKDITTLFMDTGIGSDSYAIISLSMVDDILNDKEQYRRKMFEQAAGISKYKTRKQETLNKLESTNEDLNRVEDLLFEINKNLESLEKQAKRTQKFFEIKEQYKELSLDLIYFRNSKLKNIRQELKLQLQKEEDKLLEINTKIIAAEAAIEADKKKILDEEQHLSGSQKLLNELVASVRNLENEKQILQQKQNYTIKNKERATQEIEQFTHRLNLLNDELHHYQTLLNDEKIVERQLENQLEKTNEKLQNIKQQHGNFKTELDTQARGQQILEAEKNELEKQIVIKQQQLSHISQEVKKNTEEVKLRNTELVEITKNLDLLTPQIEHITSKKTKIDEKEIQRLESVKHSEQLVEKISKLIAETHRQADAKRNEFKLTKSMVDNLEGFPESIKFLNNNKSWVGNQAPLLTDILYCKEEYRIVIENFLEPYLNYYVVENVTAAMQAIQMLSDAQKGKANFFVLSAFDNLKFDNTIASSPKGIAAIEVVEVEKRYLSVCQYLLEKVVIIDDEFDEIANQNNLQNDLILISKSGRFISSKLSLSGGAIGLFEGKKIGRKKNLEILEKEIKQLEEKEFEQTTQLKIEQKQLDDLRFLNYRTTINELTAQHNQLMQQQVSFTTKKENITAFIQSYTNKNIENQQLIKNIELEIEAKNVVFQQKKNEITNLINSVAASDQAFQQLAEQLSEASANYNAANIEVVKQVNKVNVFQQEFGFRQKQIQELTLALDKNKKDILQFDEEQQFIVEEFAAIEKQLHEKYLEKKDKETQLTTQEQGYFQLRNQVNEAEEMLRKNNRLSQDLQVQINSLKDKANDTKMQLMSLEERLQIEFNLTLNAIADRNVAEQTKEEELKISVERIRSRLDNYGEINPLAIEAYNEIKIRFDDISQQRNDILAAKESLLQTIQEIETTATNQFLNAFNSVRDNFINVFRNLFTEDDQCDLLLENPDKPLESNIQIIAKPKGKRPQTVNQLSGGEKTLTATALLFALYLLKPAPFCIFDEVDAPLDDINIEKFNNIIRNFS